MIKKTRLWDFSEQLIAEDTVSFKSNSRASSYIANILDDLGFQTHIEKFDDHGISKEQVIAWIGPEVEGGLILSGHIDTVPFENQVGWTRDALKFSLDGDKIYGRGTCDMKVFIAHCLDAFHEVDLEKLTKPLVCIFTSDEETGCQGAHRLTHNLKTILKNMPMPKRAVIGEPTGFDIINTHKGVAQFKLRIQGLAGHSSRPDLGRNAIIATHKIVKAVSELNERFLCETPTGIRKDYPDYPFNYLHLATINGGQAANMIPDLCEMVFSYRLFPGEVEDKIFKDFVTQIKNLNLDHEVEFEYIYDSPAMLCAHEPELENLLREITHKETRSVSFATDGGHLSKLGIQTFVCGAGQIAQAHMPDEFISVEDYQAGTGFVKNIIEKLLF